MNETAGCPLCNEPMTMDVSYLYPLSYASLHCLSCEHTIPADVETVCLLWNLRSKYSSVSIERILRLPFGSIDNWGISMLPEEKALLRIISHFPHLIPWMDENL